MLRILKQLVFLATMVVLFNPIYGNNGSCDLNFARALTVSNFNYEKQGNTVKFTMYLAPLSVKDCPNFGKICDDMVNHPHCGLYYYHRDMGSPGYVQAVCNNTMPKAVHSFLENPKCLNCECKGKQYSNCEPKVANYKLTITCNEK